MNSGKTLTIRSAPHVASGSSVDQLMLQVVLALLPICGFAIYAFGLAAVMMLVVAVVSCVATEHLICWLGQRKSTIGDGSAAVTGLLFGLTLPPGLALWMVMVGGVAAIAVGKAIFGGLGYNAFNPALVGRALLQAAFPVAMTTWPTLSADRFTTLPHSTLTWPFMKPEYDAVSAATPLATWKFDHVSTEVGDLFWGNIDGSTGETSAALILIGGAYLLARRVMSWHIPAAIFLTVTCCSWVLHQSAPHLYAGPLFMLSSGGLMLGAVFMATDPVGSPMTKRGCLLYGVLIGLLVVMIRNWGGMPEGVMYSILLANAVSPHLDHWLQPRAYGTVPRGKTDA